MASPSLLRRLSLPEDLPLIELASVPWTAPDETVPLAALLAQGHADPARFDPLPWSDELTPGCSVWRSRERPELVRIEGPAVASSRTDRPDECARVGSSALVIRAREGLGLTVGARLLSVERETLSLAALPSAEVEAQELRPSLLAALEALPSPALWQSPREAALDELFAGLALEPWLRADALELAERTGAHASFAAVGLVLRLHEPQPEPGQSASSLLSAALAGQRALPSLPALAARWWDARPQERESVVSDALRECAALSASLEALSESAEREHPALAAIALRWVRRRDDLESARHALAIVGASAELDRATSALDEAASAHLTLLSALAPFEAGPRFSAVSWQQPHLWWSGLLA